MSKMSKKTAPTPKEEKVPDIQTIYSVARKSPGWVLVELVIDMSTGKVMSTKQVSEPDVVQITVGKLQQKVMSS